MWKYHTQLSTTSLNEIFDLTAGVYFYIYMNELTSSYNQTIKSHHEKLVNVE